MRVAVGDNALHGAGGGDQGVDLVAGPLAYERTALGLLVTGLAVAGSRAVADAPLWFSAMGVPLIVLGAAVAMEGRRRFLSAQRAMRTGEPLGAPAVAQFLPWGIAAVAVVGAVAALIQLTSSG